VTLLEEGEKSKNSTYLGRYFVGYGVQSKERVTIFSSSPEIWQHLVPKPMEKRKMGKLSELKEADKQSVEGS
jgi:hypothetical protein